MDEQPSKRRGRPRKVVDLPASAPEGEDASSDNLGNGEAGGDRIESPAQYAGSAEGWMGFVDRLKAMTYHPNRIEVRIAYHPAPKSELIIANWSIPVKEGPIGYSTADGEFHPVEG